MDFHVYIIYSQARDKYYIGFTSDDLNKRIKRHNTNHKGFTGHAGDWILRHSERFSTKHDAIKRESQIKKWKSWKRIEELIRASGNNDDCTGV